MQEKIFPGNFRPVTLRGFYDARRVWQSAPRAKHLREEMTLRLLYEALPLRAIQSFAAAACPLTFGELFDQLRSNLEQLSGVFGDYGIKLMLDMLVLLGGVPATAISRWPVACPGYAETLAVLFPGLPPALHLQALYWVHREFGKTWFFQFPESCAQLCWNHRRRAGRLDDTIEFV